MTREEAIYNIKSINGGYNVTLSPSYIIDVLSAIGVLKFEDEGSHLVDNLTRCLTEANKDIIAASMLSPSTLSNLKAAIEAWEIWFKGGKPKSTDTFRYATNVGDKNFLVWLHQRLLNVHGEKPNVDYMLTLKRFIDNWS